MNKIKEFDSRKLTEMAVEEMRKSIDERREDGKACPKVGAVLVLPDGSIHKAHRGELREGDHAEYTLLERKLRDKRLDEAVLFATLEPCAPDARKPPKLGCAERIVNARIKEVWVGIEDPDPTVDRKGIEFLRKRGVEVHLFDRDLQEIIREANQSFIEQALERAEESQKSEVVLLSTLENPASATLEDFSDEALERYREKAVISTPINSSPFKDRLVAQGLAAREGDQILPTGFGMLLFGKEPSLSMPQARLLATIHYPDGEKEIKDFDGPMALIPDQVEKWLSDKLPNVIDRSAMQRSATPPLPFEMVREAVVNALVHRNYDIAGAKTHLIVTPDTIVIRSPGHPVEPITVERMKSFDPPILSRNPALHRVFAQMGLAEERGLGVKSLRRRAKELGLPLPRYDWENPYLALTLYRNSEAAVNALSDDVRSDLTGSERDGLQWLTEKGRIKASEYAEAMQIDGRTARRHLNHFIELGLVRKVGAASATAYEMI